MRSVAAAAAALVAIAVPSVAEGAASSRIAALQVALQAKSLYAGAIDGVAGRATVDAVKRFQRRAGLTVDGVAGPTTRSALGRLGKPELGARELRLGAAGWDVARLQFLLAQRGFPSGTIDGGYGSHVEAAVRRFQRWAGLVADGRAGPATVAAVLRSSVPRSPLALSWPASGPVGERFGARGARFHTGIDFPVAAGTPVVAAASGKVAYAGWHPGGWGLVVTIRHGHGLRTMYAHLSRVDVRVGAAVAAREQIGLVGATGRATGPHLHFEARLRGAALDPLPALR